MQSEVDRLSRKCITVRNALEAKQAEIERLTRANAKLAEGIVSRDAEIITLRNDLYDTRLDLMIEYAYHHDTPAYFELYRERQDRRAARNEAAGGDDE